MEDIKELRENIDRIDREIISLFEDRMEIVLKVAQYKKENNISIFNEAREKEVIEKNLQRLKNKNLGKFCEKFLQEIMDVSKEYQRQVLEK